MTDRPARLFDEYTPIHDNLAAQFARRELTDARLAEVVEGWQR